MPTTERRLRRIDIKLPPSGGGSSADGGGDSPVPPSIPTPPAPSGLTVDSTFLLFSAVSPMAGANLSWFAPSGLTPDSYVVQWATDSGFTTPTTRPTGGAATTAGIDGLPVATAVYFRVAAVVRGVTGMWSNTASTTTPSDTTAPAAPTSFSYMWNGQTGDLTITWTNPTSANFRDVRVRIYASNGGALLREVHWANPPYVWTLAQQSADTSGVYDPAVYVMLTSRSWSGVYSATDLTGSPTLAVPATPSGLTSSWAGDTGTAGPNCLITWTSSAAVARYRLSIDSLARDVVGGRYDYPFAQNQAEHSGTPDPALSLSLVAVDALGQSSTAATTTATNAAPPAATLAGVFAGTSTVGLTITPSTALDLLDYRVRVYKSAVLVDTVFTPDARPTITVDDGSGSYTFDVAARDVFGQVGTASAQSSAISLIDWAAFVSDLRSGLIYSDSISTAAAALAGLKDGQLAANVITYTSSTPYRWTQGDWQQTISHQTSELVTTASAQYYMATSTDGVTWLYYAGGTPAAGRWLLTVSAAGSEATAQANAVTLSSGTWRIDLPTPAQCRYIRIYHRNTGGSYTFREWFPSTLLRATYMQAESITSVNIAAGAITGDRISATAINGFTITGATIQTAASGERVVLDSSGLKTYDSAGVVQVEATTATDGALRAGAGAVRLDKDGISIPVASTSDPLSAYKFTSTLAYSGALGLFASESIGETYTHLYNWSTTQDASATVWPWAQTNTDRAYIDLNASRGIGFPLAASEVKVIIMNEPSLSRVEIIGAGLHVGAASSTAVAEGHAKIDGGLNIGSATGASAGQVKMDGASAGVIIGDRSTSAEWVLYADSGLFRVHLTGTGDRFALSSTGMAFFGASGNTKQTVTGSRGGNAALASLLTALDSYGLITNSTTA